MKNYWLVITLLFLVSCQSKKENKISESDDRPYFEGEIELEVTQGLYGELFKQYTTYNISENVIKREQKLSGVNKIFDNYAGIIIDLKKDSVLLYYVSKLENIKNKYALSIKDYKKYLDSNNIAASAPSPFDLTFIGFDNFNFVKQKKDSLKIQNFMCDYALYKYDKGITKHEIFDTKEIKVKRALLEMLFINLPEEINFPLKSDFKTTISDISNDTILNGENAKSLETLTRKLIGKQSPTDSSSVEKISKNKWVNLGIKIFKKAVDMNVHISTNLVKINKRVLSQNDLSIASNEFLLVDNLELFLNSIPKNNHGEIDN